jgi:hypothetical protein
MAWIDALVAANAVLFAPVAKLGVGRKTPYNIKRWKTWLAGIPKLPRKCADAAIHRFAEGGMAPVENSHRDGIVARLRRDARRTSRRAAFWRLPWGWRAFAAGGGTSPPHRRRGRHARFLARQSPQEMGKLPQFPHWQLPRHHPKDFRVLTRREYKWRTRQSAANPSARQIPC